MPYILSEVVSTTLPGLWGEGNPYSTEQIYDIAAADPAAPPVNYASHTLKPHSIAHIDFPAHIVRGGATCERYYRENDDACFYGPVTVVRLPGSGWQPANASAETMLWTVSSDELIAGLERASGSSSIPDKLFLTADEAPRTRQGMHDPAYVLVLGEEAARMLVSNPGFNAFGTSWKSSDFQPGSRERPIHKILLKQAVLYECLKLDHVPEGQYFLSGYPLPLEGASESPVVPVLFEQHELK